MRAYIGALCVLGWMACGKDVFRPLRTNTEEFKQNAAAQIDALWVVDDSSSMAEEQTGLGESFQAFIESLAQSGVDYHIGVVSTDTSKGGVLNAAANTPAFITPQTTNPQQAFLANVKLGTQGARQEKAFEAAALALGKGSSWRPGRPASPPVANKDFIRENASLFVIMVSDEDDKSFGPVDYYRRLFESYKGFGNEARVSVSAIVGDVGGAEEGCRGEKGNAEPGYRYVDLAGQTGGIWTSICGDFNEALAQLSLTAAGLRALFKLEKTPDMKAFIGCDNLPPAPLCVRVNGTALPMGTDPRTGWRYTESAQAVVFGSNNIPPPQAVVTVQYQELP
jgi:hypothetical protein